MHDRTGDDDFAAEQAMAFNKAHDSGKAALGFDRHEVRTTINQLADHGGFDIGGMQPAETPQVHRKQENGEIGRVAERLGVVEYVLLRFRPEIRRVGEKDELSAVTFRMSN